MCDFKDVHKHSKELNVLYVEDDKDLLEETEEFLEDFFKEVVTAFDGVDGIEKYRKHKKDTGNYFDLVITDINMPRADGITLIKEIKDANKEQPIIVLSAYNESGRVVDLIQAGISNFVMKPVSIEQFLPMLYTTCKNISNQKQIDKL